MTNDPSLLCPCCSGKSYKDCCSVYHQGKEAENALALMRSRYSAYAFNNVDYIVRTTHPRNPAVSQNVAAWKQAILNFSLNTDFDKLEVLDYKEKPNSATVVFIAHLKQDEEDVTFTERSFFAKVDGRWFYVNGDVFPGENKDIKA
jgi:SEC-C motif-containing protein